MSERRPGTRLPDDPSYWENLAARSVDAAFGATAAPVASRSAHVHDGAITHPWWRGISDSAFMLAASAVLALLGGSLLIDERSPREITAAHAMLEPHAIDALASTESRGLIEPNALAAVLAPDSPLLVSLLDAPAGPPSASALLRLIALREEER